MNNIPKNDLIANKWLYVIMLVMLISGAGDTVILKLIIETRDSHNNKFKHPYIMAWVTFTAGSIGQIIYTLYMKTRIRKFGSYDNVPEVQSAVDRGKKPSIAFYWLIIPAMCNFFSIPLMNLGLSMIDASVYQMMRGFLIFLTAILSITFLKSTLYRHHWLAIFFIVLGVATVGFSSIENSKENENVVLGIVLILMSQLFSALHWIIEEKILHTHFLHPFRLVGIQGISSLIWMIISVIIMQFISCSGKLCPNGKLDDASVALDQIKENYHILVYVVMMICSVWTFQTSGVCITKYGSSTHRCSIDIARIILIWVFFLLYQGNGHENFEIIQFIGFIIILIGAILYNEIYVPPIFALNRYTKANLKQKEKLQEELVHEYSEEINISQSTTNTTKISRH